MREISNARRIMKVRDILFNHTDENHEISLTEIINQLKSHFGSEYHVSRNTVKGSINELRDCGFNIEENVGVGETAYYSHQYRKFEVHELRMLIDAISSARFIAASETKQLIEKIKTLTSKHLAKKLHLPHNAAESLVLVKVAKDAFIPLPAINYCSYCERQIKKHLQACGTIPSGSGAKIFIATIYSILKIILIKYLHNIWYIKIFLHQNL